MLTIIKTGIVTIILSFISGVLLDYYKNRSPRIVCNISGGEDVENNEKKIKVYNVTVKNSSKTTIHNLNLNLHTECDCLRIENAKITKGLKFDVSGRDNIYDVSIPFLSKNDEFSVKVFLEDKEEINSIPSVVLRSPERFKIINSRKSMSKNAIEKSSAKKRNSKGLSLGKINLIKYKKVIIAAAAAVVLLCGGLFVVKNIGKADDKAGTAYETTNNDESADESVNTSNKSSAESNDKSKPSKAAESSTKSENSNGGSTNSSEKPADNSKKESSKGEPSKEESNSAVNKSEDNSKDDTEKNISSSEKKESSNKEATSEDTKVNSEEKSESKGMK